MFEHLLLELARQVVRDLELLQVLHCESHHRRGVHTVLREDVNQWNELAVRQPRVDMLNRPFRGS
jgi:hypothetical protein